MADGTNDSRPQTLMYRFNQNPEEHEHVKDNRRQQHQYRKQEPREYDHDSRAQHFTEQRRLLLTRCSASQVQLPGNLAWR